jgi:hypothetical protein
MFSGLPRHAAGTVRPQQQSLAAGQPRRRLQKRVRDLDVDRDQLGAYVVLGALQL